MTDWKNRIKGVIGLLALLLLTGVFAAAGAESFGDYEYQILSDGTARITGYHGEEKHPAIPSEADGIPVTEIGDEVFYKNRTAMTIVIPEGVKAIGEKAFSKCRLLTGITIPQSVEEIGDAAFAGNRHLSAVTIPDGVRAIGASAFADCEQLTSILIPDSVTTLGDFAFWNCAKMNAAFIPGSVRTIPFCAFGCCEKLKTVHIGEGVETIGEEAFTFCYSLGSVSIPDSVRRISQNAFYRCMNLKSVNIPDHAALEGNPFNSCDRLKEILLSPEHPAYTLVNGVLFDSIGGGSRLICHPASLKHEIYEIPEGTEEIGACAFGGCGNLKKIVIPESVTAIGNDAFKGMISPAITLAGKDSPLNLRDLPYLSPVTPEEAAAAPGGLFREQRYEAKDGTVVNYYLYLPRDGENVRKRPMLIYFHGIQDTAERHHGIGELIRTEQIRPEGIVILPQAVNETVDADFHTMRYQDAVIELAYAIAEKFGGDTERLSVSGHSDGGVTAYQIVNGHPGVFAACAPISAVGNTGDGIRQTHLWVFQGAMDSWINPDMGLRVALKCENSGCSAWHYVYEDEGHNIQTLVFLDTFTDQNGEEVKLIDWLMSREKPPRG